MDAAAVAQRIMAGLDVKAEFELLGVRLAGDSPDANGWIPAHAMGRDDRDPSAAINVQTGRYKDHGGDGTNVSLFDFAAQHASGRFADWQAARDHYAAQVGVEPTTKRRKKAKPDDHLTWRPWHRGLADFWCAIHKPGATVEALEACGARLATYREVYHVIALPVWLPDVAEPVGWVLFPQNGLTLPVWHGAKGNPPTQEKMKTTAGSQGGLIGPRDALECSVIWKTEGPTDLLTLYSHLPAGQGVITNSGGANEWPKAEVVAALAGKTVAICHDADEPGQAGVPKWTNALAARGTRTINIPLPYPVEKKHGKDLRDFLNEQGAAPLLAILDRELANPSQQPTGPVPLEADDDPHRLARSFVDKHYTQADGKRTLRHWRDEWYAFDRLIYRLKSDGNLRAELVEATKQEFDRLNLLAQAEHEKGEIPKATGVTNSVILNALQAAKSMCLLPDHRELPCWLCDDPPWPAGEVFATASGLLHLPTLVAEGPNAIVPCTPDFFGLAAVDYPFEREAAEPVRWLEFLDSLWGDDPESISLLQEWFGYCLLPDTRHHKLLMIVGPPRSGKGTIGRVIQALVGERNCTSPTLAQLSMQFGLAPLIGKTLAVIPDARLSGRIDGAQVVERLLSITGEDWQTIDRKMREAYTCRLHTRFMVMTNELPNLRDSSGAIISRVLLLKTDKSFMGKEDKKLNDELRHELPGILAWAIAGWERLWERGYFESPKSSEDLLDELHAMASPIKAFVHDCCTLDPTAVVTKDDLYQAYVGWCKESGITIPETKVFFGRNLSSAFPKVKATQMRFGTARDRVYKGLSLRPAYA